MRDLQSILEYRLFEFEKFHFSVGNIFFVLLVYVTVRLTLWIVKRVLRKRFLDKGKTDDGRLLSTLQLIRYFVYVVALVISIESIGIDITLLIGASAALLVGVGMGMQQTFNDIVSGIIILFEGTIEVGDVLEIDELVGTIKEIRLRTCKIQTREAFTVIVPNSKFVTSNVINWSHSAKTTRFNVSVGVAYGSDISLVKKLLLECAEKHGEVLPMPASFVRFENFGDSSLDFNLFFWTNKIWEVENVKSDLRFMIEDAFRESKVTIPFPQRDVHIRQNTP